MADTILLTIDWRDADSDMPEEQQETLTQTVFQELRALDEVEDIKRVADPNVPDGGMGANWLWSILTAEITFSPRSQALPGKLHRDSTAHHQFQWLRHYHEAEPPNLKSRQSLGPRGE